ncbi:unnamed protein product [Medioppia subpectinata]|uniref:Uncharacterized protein n=1 Tax=Medioppia subpectinata TaxID=1979941 RepID=A0A7R9LIP8_9ACAR|nr:unnamed protein product [Medioppia subpectinata]CAG2119098.1 unnamed protein product [Medioppia subpectinata]
MLRSGGIGGVLRAKVRGNRSFSQPRLPTTAQTAGLARVASTRSSLGVPPPVPTTTGADDVNNALPLPPRDRSRPMLMQLKTHQRRHPLVMPIANGDAEQLEEQQRQQRALMDQLQAQHQHQQREGSPLRMVPVLKQVSCPQPPQTFLDNYSAMKLASGGEAYDGIGCDKKLAPIPPPKPQRSYLGEESFESEMQKVLDSIKMDNTCLTSRSPSPPPVADTDSSTISTNHNHNSHTISDKSISTTTHTSGAAAGGDHSSAVTVAKGPQMPYKSTLNHTNSSASDHSSYSYKPMTTITAAGDSHSSVAAGSSYRSAAGADITTNGSSSRATSSYSSFTADSTPGAKKKGVDSDEVRVMQKVLANETNLSSEECAKILHSTDWDVHKAIKCIRLRQQLRTHSIEVDCDWAVMLAKFNWNIRQASNYLIATQGVPGDATEV